MKIKSLRPILLIILLICCISFFIVKYSAKKKSFDDLLGTNSTNITSVFMRDGSNGNSVATNDKGKIKEIISLVNDRYYKKSINQEPRSGYNYFYDFVLEGKNSIRITGSGSNVDIDGIYYDVSKEISEEGLRNWFNSLQVTKMN